MPPPADGADPPLPEGDAALLARVAAGEPGALDRLIARHGHGLTVVAARYLGRMAEAEEVAQEVWLRVWRRAARFDPDRAAARTWLYRIAVNMCIDRLRRRRLHRLVRLDEAAADMPETAPQAQRIVAGRRRLDHVRSEIARQPDRQRMALLLAVGAGLTGEEIAEALGTSRGGAEQLLARARRRLRARIGKAPDG